VSQTRITTRISRPRWSRWLLPALVFCVLTVAVFILANEQRKLHEVENEAAASIETAASTASIRERLKLHAQFLRSLQAFAAANPDPANNLQAWRLFARNIDVTSNLTGLFVFAYAPVIHRHEADRLTAQIQQQSDRANFKIFPPIEDETAAPVTFVAPDAPLQRKAIGFNLMSEKIRREVIESAVINQDIGLSGPVILIYDQETKRPGFILAQGSFHPGMPINNIEERHKALTGVVVLGYRADDFIDSLKRGVSDHFALQVFDDGSANRSSDQPPQLIYDSDPNFQPGPNTHVIHHEIDFGGRNWILNFRVRPELAGSTTLDTPALIIGTGLIGNTLLALLIFYLTTHRERAERYARQLTTDLAKSEERFRLAAKGTNDVLWDQNLETGEDYISPRLGEILDFSPAEAPRTSSEFITLIHPEDETKRVVALRKLLHDNAPYDVVLRVRNRHGHWHWLRIRGDAVRDTNNKVLRMAGSLSDISELHHATAAIQAADLLKQSVLDSATEVSIIATNSSGLISVFNRGAEKMLGYRASDIVGQETPVILHLKEEVEARSIELSDLFGRPIRGFETFTIVAQTATSEQREWTYVSKDGEHIAVSLVITALRDMTGEISGYLGVAVDITRQKAAEAELLQHRDHLQELVALRTASLDKALVQARAANQAKSEFLANMSHELRTPMHAILSFSELGLRRTTESADEKLKQYFSRISQSAERLLNLIDDLLDLSKLEAGRMELHYSQTNLLTLIDLVLSQLDSLAHRRNLTFSIDACAEATNVSVDMKRIEQVIHNLLANSIKFSPENGIIQITISPSQLPRGRRAQDSGFIEAISIRIADSGVGIPESELESIFDKFVQSSSTKTGAGGTGLGLAICQEIVTQHRGTITAANNIGSGACFTVTLPTNSEQETT
jgi:PAS domain S-box-containing protein